MFGSVGKMLEYTLVWRVRIRSRKWNWGRWHRSLLWQVGSLLEGGVVSVCDRFPGISKLEKRKDWSYDIPLEKNSSTSTHMTTFDTEISTRGTYIHHVTRAHQ